jgi:hypothetical protein
MLIAWSLADLERAWPILAELDRCGSDDYNGP